MENQASGDRLATTRAGPGDWRSAPHKGWAQEEAAAPDRRQDAPTMMNIAGAVVDERPAGVQIRRLATAPRNAGRGGAGV